MNHKPIGQLHLTNYQTLGGANRGAQEVNSQCKTWSRAQDFKWRTVKVVTCRLRIKLKSGGPMPKFTQKHASSDTLLLRAALAGAAEAGEGNVTGSPGGLFILAAGRKKCAMRKHATTNSSLGCLGNMQGYIPSFLFDRLLFCCWPVEGAGFTDSWDVGLPFPAPSIFSISLRTRVPF